MPNTPTGAADDPRSQSSASAPQSPALVQTAEDLDALLRDISEQGEPAVIRTGSRIYILTEDDRGDFWAWSWLEEGETRTATPATGIPLPWEVLSRPNHPAPPPHVHLDALTTAAAVWQDAFDATVAAVWADPEAPRFAWTPPMNPYPMELRDDAR